MLKGFFINIILIPFILAAIIWAAIFWATNVPFTAVSDGWRAELGQKEVFRGSFEGGEGENRFLVRYSLAYPKDYFTVENPQGNRSTLTLMEKKTDQVHTIRIVPSAASLSPEQYFIMLGSCASCRPASGDSVVKNANELAIFENNTEEWLVHSFAGGFVVAKLSKPVSEAKKILEGLEIDFQRVEIASSQGGVGREIEQRLLPSDEPLAPDSDKPEGADTGNGNLEGRLMIKKCSDTPSTLSCETVSASEHEGRIVYIYNSERELVASTRADGRGRFEAVLPPASYYIEVLLGEREASEDIPKIIVIEANGGTTANISIIKIEMAEPSQNLHSPAD